MWPLFLLACCTQSPAAGSPVPVRPPVATAVGRHFQVEVRFDSQAVADEALAAAESVVAAAEAVYGPECSAPDPRRAHPLPIVIYATREQSKADLGALGLLAAHILHHDRAVPGYVCLEPELSPERIAAVGLSMHARWAIASEAVRVLAYEVAAAGWPEAKGQVFWFGEGAALWAAEEGLTSTGLRSDRMEEPVFATVAMRVRSLKERGWLPSLEVIATGWPGGLAAVERPAVGATAFRFLKDPSRKDVFARVAAAARTFDFTPDSEARMRTALGDEKERAALEAAFAAYVDALQPGWLEAVPAMWSSGSRWLQAAASGRNAIAWRGGEPAGSPPYALEGEFEILPGATQQMNVLLAGNAKEFVQVSFVAGHGIDVFRCVGPSEPKPEWTKLATVEVKGLNVGRSIPFRLTVEGSVLSVSISGKPACSAPLDPKAPSGHWGLGVQAESAGWWRNVGFGRL